MTQEAEVVERELKELPEGYILYILRIRRHKGLGTLSIQTTPGGQPAQFGEARPSSSIQTTQGSAGSTAVSEGEEIRIKLAKVSVRFERPADIKLSLNAEAPSVSALRQLQLVPVGVSFNSVSPISLKVDERAPVNVVPSAKISLQPVTVSFSRPSAVSLQLDGSNHVPQRITYELKPVSVTFAQPGRASLGNVSDGVRGLGVTLASSIRSATERVTELATTHFAPPSPSISSKSATTPAAAPSPHELSEGEIEEVEKAVDSALFGLGRLVPDRPLLIVAEHVKGFGYVEFLKRALREVYRVRVGGLPEPKHVSNVADLRLLIPVEVGAGGRLFVIDLVSGDLGDLLKNSDVKGPSQALLVRIMDRLRELFSQGYGFIVIYGDHYIDILMRGAWAEALRGGALKNYLLTIPRPSRASPEISKESLYVLLANLMWGRVSEPKMDYEDIGSFDGLVVELEDEYWRALEGALKDFNVQVLVRPSAEGDEAGRESMSHYLTKAFMVNYLVRRLTEEFKGKGAKEDEARRRALDCVRTEHQPGGANVRFDVYVKDNKDANSDCGSMSDLVVEVETLYGTGTALHKVLDTIESRVNAGVNRLWASCRTPRPSFTCRSCLGSRGTPGSSSRARR